MKIYVALKKDHQKLTELLDRLVICSEGGDPQWRRVVGQIRDELIPHSRAEEALFYNAIRDTEHGRKVVAHSYAEHMMAETELRALEAMQYIDANWTGLAKKLRRDLMHHVEQEEKEVFAAARMIFSDEEADQIGEAFLQLKSYVKGQGITGQTLDLITNLLPKRLVIGFRKHFSHHDKDKDERAA
jgi:hemerythrin superfamily protein